MAKSKIEKGVTLIGTNTVLTGDVKFVDQLYVNGCVNGNIFADDAATLIISEEGTVKGEIRVPDVVINGAVEGAIYSSGRLELATKAKVCGNVYYSLIEMQLGATVDGQLVHQESLAESGNRKVHPLRADPAIAAAAEQSQEPRQQ